MGPIRQAHFSHIDIRTSVAIDVCQQQVVGAVRGEPEHVPVYPPLRGIVRALPPLDIIATVTGAGNQIEAAIPGEVDKHTADTDARECIIHQVRFPVTAACRNDVSLRINRIHHQSIAKDADPTSRVESV